MKKLYTIALAAAVAATASAAPNHAFGKTAAFTKESNAMALNATVVKDSNAGKGFKAPANNPASLDGLTYIMTYGFDYKEYSTESSVIEFELVKSNAIEGYDEYALHGLLDGMFSNISVLPQTVYYSVKNGELVMPAGQDFCDLSGTMCTTFNLSGQSVYSDVEFLLKWDGSSFVWEPNMTLTLEDGTSKDFTSEGMFVGAIQEGGKVGGLFVLDNFVIKSLNGELNYTMSAKGQSQAYSSPLSVTVEGNNVAIANFDDMMTLNCTLDTEAKTLTAKNGVYGQANVGSETNPVIVNAYISAAENDNAGGFAYNAAGDGVYELVMNYTTANGKTQVTMPDWNVFIMDNGEDLDALGYLISKSTMTFDFELGAATEGVSDIITDDSNAPVEYFNLQGVRVANPENGLYIRRQGSKAQKVLVK